MKNKHSKSLLVIIYISLAINVIAIFHITTIYQDTQFAISSILEVILEDLHDFSSEIEDFLLLYDNNSAHTDDLLKIIKPYEKSISLSQEFAVYIPYFDRHSGFGIDRFYRFTFALRRKLYKGNNLSEADIQTLKKIIRIDKEISQIPLNNITEINKKIAEIGIICDDATNRSSKK